MANWYLLVKATHGDYEIRLGPDEPKALTALQEAGDNIGMNGRTTITIEAVQIVRRAN